MGTYFITGITGFLGYNITLLLNQNNEEIVGFALKNDPNIALFKSFKNVRIVEGNILNKDDVENFLASKASGDKYLIHAAGKITTLKKGDPSVYKINYEGTKNIVDSVKSKNFKKVLYVSSVDCMKYRKDKGEIFEQDSFNEDETLGQYGKSKVLANNYVKQNLDNYIIVMPGAIFGPNDPLNSAINSAIDKAIKNKLPATVKGGYNLVDARDVSLGIIKALQSEKTNEIYSLTGNYISVKELIDRVSKIANSKKVRLSIPHVLIKMVSPLIELDAKIHKKTPLFTGFSMDCLKQNSNYSNLKAKNDLGFEVRDLSETLKDTIEFLRNKK